MKMPNGIYNESVRRSFVRDICPAQMILSRLVSASQWISSKKKKKMKKVPAGPSCFLFFLFFILLFLPFTMIFHNQRGRKAKGGCEMSRKSRSAVDRHFIPYSNPFLCRDVFENVSHSFFFDRC